MGETRRTRRFGALATACICSVLVVGCATPSKQQEDPSPTSTGDSVLSEAIGAYTRYSAAFDAVRSANPREADTSGLKKSVTVDYWDLLEAELTSDHRSWRQKGSSAFGQEELVESSSTGASARVVITVCVDLSHTTLIDENGDEISAPDRRLIFPTRVSVEEGDGGTFLVADATAMEETKTCGS